MRNEEYFNDGVEGLLDALSRWLSSQHVSREVVLCTLSKLAAATIGANAESEEVFQHVIERYTAYMLEVAGHVHSCKKCSRRFKQ